MAKDATAVLPDWADYEGDNTIVVDPDKAYPALLRELDVKQDEIDQYWAEVAYQCMKMDLQAAMDRFNFQIKVLNRPKWALASLKPGKGAEAATQGREARAHYMRLRGALPG